MQNKIKTRIFPESNYRSVFINNKTIRQAIDPSKPITELRFAEFYDISFGSKCLTGKCNFCYASASKSGVYYKNLAEKINKFFGSMTENQRPTSVAVGGSMESFENPETREALQAFYDLGITPNCTSNGVLVNEDIIEMMRGFGGTIAISCYHHTEKYWRKAVKMIQESKIGMNLHCIISDKESIDWMDKIWQENKDKTDYLVVLPHMNVGFGAKIPKKVDWEYFTKFLDREHLSGQIAIGANGYKFLEKNAKRYKLNLYEPELFSKYLHLDDNLSTYNNSFDMKPVPFIPGEGFELGHARTNFPACD